MRLNQDRSGHLDETLDALCLSADNRKRAQAWMDCSQPEDAELLSRMEKQDFSKLTREQQMISKSYMERCEKRGKKEELDRYIRFLFAVGGSTSFYVSYETYQINRIGFPKVKELVGPAAAASMVIEAVAWNENLLNANFMSELFTLGKKDPNVFLEAFDCCQNEYNNGQLLAAALYLHCLDQKNSRTGAALFKSIGKLLGQGGGEADAVTKKTEYLRDSLIDAVPVMITGLSDFEKSLISKYLKTGAVSDEIPTAVRALLTAHAPSDYLIRLLASCAFLAMDASGRFEVFLKFCAAASLSGTMNACRQITQGTYFNEHEEQLESILDVPAGDYISWCASAKLGGALRRMSAKHPGEYEDVLKKTDMDSYKFMVQQLKAGNPSLYKELSAGLESGLMEKIAKELTDSYQPGGPLAKDYLLGSVSLDTLYQNKEDYRGERYGYWSYSRLLEDYEKSVGCDAFYRRCITFLGLSLKGYFFANRIGRSASNKTNGDEEIPTLFQMLEEEGLPMEGRLDLAGAIYDAMYSDSQKAALLDAVSKYLRREKVKGAEELIDAAKKSCVTGRYLGITFMDNWPEEYKQELLGYAGDNSKQVRELLAAVLSGHREWEEDIRGLLRSRKSAEREMAVLVMKAWGADAFREDLSAAIESEKSKKLADLIGTVLGMPSAGEQPSAAGEPSLEDLVKELHKGGKKRKLEWAYQTPFVCVHKQNGEEASEEYLQALALCYAGADIPGVSKEAVRLAEPLDKRELGIYACEMFDKWLEAGAESKKKWVLYFASVHGGEEIVRRLTHQINEWPQHARGAIAAEAVKALALNDSPSALLTVDSIARKFKFRQIKTAAGEALEFAASQLGLTREELEDKIVPDLGFDETMARTFDYGERKFKVYLTPALEIEVYDDNEKKLKNLPAPGKKDDEALAKESYEAFKQMKKQMKITVSAQKLRLEQALSTERKWSADRWKALFVKNPVMHQFAISLIWGVYEDDRLTDTFRYMEDGSFNTWEEDVYELPENASIGLVHPIELTEESLKAWKQQLEDYEVEQSVEQLNRPIYKADEGEMTAAALERFGGKILNGLSLSGKLQSMGWYRGSVQDAGGYYTYYREDPSIGIGVELEFSGLFVGDENEEITVYEAKFYKAGTVKRGSYVYDEVTKKNTFLLGQVPARYFSEIVYQLEKATASSKERNENWREKK